MSIEMVEEEAFNSGTMIKVIGVGGGGGLLIALGIGCNAAVKVIAVGGYLNQP